MPVFDVEHNGEVYEVEASTQEQALQAFMKNAPRPVPSQFERDRYTVGTILPFKRDNVTGDVTGAVPGLVSGAWDMLKGAVTLPGEVYSGQTSMIDPETGRTSPEVIERSADTAMLFSPTTPGGLPKGYKKPMRSARDFEPNEAGLAARRQGIQMPSAVSSNNTSVRNAARKLQDLPVVGAPLKKGAQRAIDQTDDVLARTRSQYGSASSSVAGEGAREGIEKTVKSSIPGFVKRAYQPLDDVMDPGVKVPLTSTRKTFDKLVGRRESAALNKKSPALELVEEAVKRDGLNYEGLKRLRSELGSLKSNTFSAEQRGFDVGEIKQLYSSLTDDLRNLVRQSGGDDAIKLFEKANKANQASIEATGRLSKILRLGSDESIVGKMKTYASNRGGADIKALQTAKASVGREQWDDVAGAILKDMGFSRARGEFSPDIFVTQWNTLSPEGKRILFGGTGKEQLVQSLDDIAKIATQFKSLNEFANPSQSGVFATTAAAAAAAYFDIVSTAIVGSGLAGTSYLLSKPALPRMLKSYGEYALQYAQRPNPNLKAKMIKQLATIRKLISENEAANDQGRERVLTIDINKPVQ